MPQLYYSPVTVQSGQVPSTQSDFPMLVSYTDNRFKTTGNGGHVANANGYDIRPYSDTGLLNALTYELERYNASTGEVIMWVKQSSLADGNVIYLGYGDTSLTTDGSSSTTWSNGFYNVCHYPDGTTLSFFDSATGSNGSGTNTPTATSGQIDGAMGLASASSQKMTLPTVSFSGTQLTFSAWVKATSFPGSYNGVMGYNIGPNSFYSLLMVKSTGKLALYNQSRNYDGTGSHTLSTGTWYYLVMTLDTTTGIVGYVNGGSDGTASGALSIVSSPSSIIVGDDTGNAGRFWNGSIDEARVASVARSADWITTEYNNQSVPSTFAVLGTEVNFSPIQGIYTI